MPDANGQLQLQDYVSELKARGFDGFQDADLKSLVNRGYLYVARKFPAYWDMANYSGSVPANGQVEVSDTGSLIGFKSVEAVYWYQSSTSYVRLVPLSERDFRDQWLREYQQGTRANPQVYYIDGNTLWVLPVMANPSGTLEIRYNKRPTPMTSDTAVPVTPVDFDEVIMTAALVRCHKRANETELAIVAQQELEEALDDIRDIDGSRMQDQQDRVSPDDTWL